MRSGRSCLEVKWRRVDGDLAATFEGVGRMTCSFGMVCSSSIGGVDILWGADGKVLNVHGNKIYVTIK